MLVGRFCFQFVQLFGATKEIDTLRIPTIHTIYPHMCMCVTVCIYSFFPLLFVYYFFAICRCYFITYVVFIRPVQLWKPKVNICRRSLRLLILLDQLSNQIKYRVLCKLHDNWPKLMNGNERERERERFVARTHSHSCQCSVECITNFLLFRSMKSLNSGESAT